MIRMLRFVWVVALGISPLADAEDMLERFSTATSYMPARALTATCVAYADVYRIVGMTSNNGGSSDGVGTSVGFQSPTGVAITPDGSIAVIVGVCILTRNESHGASSLALAQTTSPSYFFGQADSGNNAIRRVDVSSVTVTTIAGGGASGTADGTGTSARFNALTGIAVTASGTFALIVRTKCDRKGDCGRSCRLDAPGSLTGSHL